MKSHPTKPEASDLRRVAAFHQLSPNPVIVVNSAGDVTFASDGAKVALESLGKDASPEVFLPKDIGAVLAALKRRKRATFRREVTVGDRVFEESIHVMPGQDAAGIYATDISERRRAELELRGQTVLFKALVESPPDIIVFALDREYRYTAFNTNHVKEMKKVYGADIRPGMNLLDIINIPEVRAKAKRSIDRALAGESFTEVEPQPGLGIWYEFNWNPIRAADGSVEGVTAFIHDVTARKQAEAALGESEFKYRRVFETSNDAMMLLDMERFFDCNEAALRVFGYSTRDEFLGKHPAEVSPPRQADGRDSWVAANESIATAFRDGRDYFEWLHQRADGTVFPAEVLLTPLDFHAHRVLQATVRDISDRKRAEAALIESEERYRRLVEETGEGIGICDADERFSFANRAAEEIFGIPRGGLVGRNLLESLDAEQAALVLQQTARRRTGESSSYELVVTRPDGTRRTVLVTASPQRDADGNYTGAFAIFRDYTARRRAEQQVQTERDKLRRILDAMPDGVYVVGRDYELQYVNPTLFARGGPVNGRRCYEYFHSRTEPCPDCANPQVFAGGTTRREYTTQQGVTYDIQDVPVTGDDGRPARLVFLRDITARKRTEEALRESEARFKRLFEESPSGVALIDVDGVVQEANPMLLKLLGVRREELVGRSFRQLLPAFGLDLEKQDDDFRKRIAGEPAARELTFRGQNGSQTTIEVRSSIVGNPGRAAGVMYLITDITARKQAEERNRQHLEDTALLRDTALGFIQLAPDADIYQYVADCLCRLTGEAYVIINSHDEATDQFTVRAISGIGARLETVLKVMGRNPVGTTFALDPENRPGYASRKLLKFEDGIYGLSYGRLPRILAQTIEKTFDLGGTYAMGFHWQGRILGTMNLIMRRGADVRDPGVVEAFVNQAAIALQHRRDADELDRYRKHLEELVRERTAELETANGELEAFSFSVSHDLRTPLRAMDGFTQTLLADCGPQLDAEARGHLNEVSAAARQMEELIEDLLNLARVTRQPLDRKPVDLSGIARTIAVRLKRTAPDRAVEFVISEGLTALADQTLVTTALQNLLDNAWKFTARHPSARIEFGETRVDGERVWFVRDDGAGFEMDYVNQLFKPFRRLHTEHDFPGCGIGLAIVERVVRRHGGRVWIEAEVERGATCRFTLGPASKEA